MAESSSQISLRLETGRKGGIRGYTRTFSPLAASTCRCMDTAITRAALFGLPLSIVCDVLVFICCNPMDILRMFLWWSSCTLCLLACQVRVTAGESGLCSCVPCCMYDV